MPPPCHYAAKYGYMPPDDFTRQRRHAFTPPLMPTMIAAMLLQHVDTR